MLLGLYHYLGITTPEARYRSPASEKLGTPQPLSLTSGWTTDEKFHKIVKSCSLTESISIGAEGNFNNFLEVSIVKSFDTTLS